MSLSTKIDHKNSKLIYLNINQCNSLCQCYKEENVHNLCCKCTVQSILLNTIAIYKSLLIKVGIEESYPTWKGAFLKSVQLTTHIIMKSL